MGKLTLGDLVTKHTVIKNSAQKHGINIIGIFGSMVGGKDIKNGALQLLISWKENTSLFHELDFKQDLKGIFTNSGEIVVHFVTEERIKKSIENYVMTEQQGQEILKTAKTNPLDKLAQQFQEQQTSVSQLTCVLVL